jgi:hypothetical protein
MRQRLVSVRNELVTPDVRFIPLAKFPPTPKLQIAEAVLSCLREHIHDQKSPQLAGW